MYIYESNLGYLYTSKKLIPENKLIREDKYHSDWLIGEAGNKADAWELLECITGFGGYDFDDVNTFINENFK